MLRRFKTLRARFALWTAGLILAVLAIFGLFVYTSMARGLTATLDNGLVAQVAQATAALGIENGKLNIHEGFLESPENSKSRAPGLTIRILTPNGETLQTVGAYHLLAISLGDLPTAPTFSTVRDPTSQDTIRIYTTPVVDSGRLVAFVQVVQSLTEIRAILQRLLTTLLISTPLLAVVAALSGYWLAGRALAPIDRITRMARRISAEDLTARLNLPNTADEVGRLAATFDAMLTRLADSFRRERQFIGDASHELRTPLAVMQAILSTIRTKRRTTEEYEQALDDLGEEADRLRNLAENLLQLARSEAENKTERVAVDLSTLLHDVVDSMQPLANAKGLGLNALISPALSLAGDSDSLVRLFVNLLENAIKYTPQGKITLTTPSVRQGLITVRIADSGIGIAPADQTRIFDRLYQVDAARATSGAGLGLAIAQKIAYAHQGAITVQSTVGRGSTFTVQFGE